MFQNEKLYISELKSVVYTENQTEQKTDLRRSHVFGMSASTYGAVINCFFGGKVIGLYQHELAPSNKHGKVENCCCIEEYGNLQPNYGRIKRISDNNIPIAHTILNSTLEDSAAISGVNVSELALWKSDGSLPVLTPKSTYITQDKSMEDGSKEHPFTISSADEFMEFTDRINGKDNFEGKYILQTADIDLAGRTDYNGTNGSGYPYTFAGVYDGGGHIINVELDTVGQAVNNTVFPYIEGIVMNLGVTGSISGGGLYTTGFARSVRPGAVLLNCFSKATVSTRSEHGKMYELCCIMSGNVKVYYDDEEYTLEPGSVIYIPKNIACSDYHTDFLTPCDSISIFFDTDYALPEKLFVADVSYTKNLETQFDKIYRTWISRKSKYYLSCMALLYEVIADLSSPSGNYLPKDKYVKIEKGIKYLISHCFDKHIDYNMPAEICGISYTYFKQLFIQKFEMPPMQHITDLRMERAVELLKTGSCSVTEIAELCGYENIYYFSKVFKKYYGVSPKKYSFTE